MKFLDTAKIYVKSGKGGAGCLSFRREKFIEFGGPDGGDGGAGGDVIAEATADLNTLIDFRYRPHIKAKNGRPGEGNNRTGARGQSAIVKVPIGTEIYDADSGQLIADLTHNRARQVLAKGGKGGIGNLAFKSSTNRAPRRTIPPGEAEEFTLQLRLKLLADVGLVGLPNAGKSTFLAAVSRAKPKIADYPFTTLHPQLGVVTVDQNSFVLTDIPGLIAGAHEGVGLGDRFLGHVERTGVLLHLVDATAADPLADYHTVRAELAAYGADLTDKCEIIALSKIDALPAGHMAELSQQMQKALQQPVFGVSAVSGAGVTDLLRTLTQAVEAWRLAEAEQMAIGAAGETEVKAGHD